MVTLEALEIRMTWLQMCYQCRRAEKKTSACSNSVPSMQRFLNRKRLHQNQVGQKSQTTAIWNSAASTSLTLIILSTRKEEKLSNVQHRPPKVASACHLEGFLAATFVASETCRVGPCQEDIKQDQLNSPMTGDHYLEGELAAE